MMIRALALAMLMLLAQSVFGTELDQRVRSAIVRISCAESVGVNSLGSGALVGNDGQTGLVVTCWHLFKDAPRGAPVVVSFVDGQRFAANIVAADATNDLAALAIRAPSVEPIPLANIRPVAGDWLYTCGYGSGDFAVSAGQVTSDLDYGPGQWAGVATTGHSRNGDSGGPLLTPTGEVAAVNWGGPNSHATGCQLVWAMLNQQCQSGVCQPRQQWRQVQSRPAQQPAQTLPKPVSPTPACVSCKCDPKRVAQLEAEVNELRGIIATVQAQKGEQGPRGPAGERGLQGERGADGAAGAISDEQLAKLRCQCSEPNTGGAAASPRPVYFDIKPHKKR